MTAAPPAVPPGIDARGVTRWFEAHVPGVTPPLAFEAIAGGRSNLTYKVTDSAGGAWVLRRPPLRGVLPSAHDMAREHRIIAALGPTPVPVPPAVGYCGDPAVTGAPFYVMGFVDGAVPRDESVTGALGERERAAASQALVDVLAELHALEPAAVGLGGLGRPSGYVERQLRRWRGQWEQSRTRELPLMDEVHARLAARVPPQGRAAIVHGDYRLDNTILGPDGRIRAVLDWELSTQGDPLADVGLLLVYWSEPGDELLPLAGRPTALPGFYTRRQLAEAYARASGQDLSGLDYYVAFGYWKLAVILEGVYARQVAGAYATADAAASTFPRLVEQLAEAARERLG